MDRTDRDARSTFDLGDQDESNDVIVAVDQLVTVGAGVSNIPRDYEDEPDEDEDP